jgi:hypothetical protein
MSLPKAIQRQAEQAAAAQAAFDQSQQQTADLIEDTSQLTPPPAEPPTPPQAPAPAPEADWKHKYETLQGLFNQRTAQAQAKTLALESQLSEIQRVVADLTKAQAQKPEAPAVMDPKDVEAFGADMLEMVKRYAEQTFNQLGARFDTKVQEFDGRLNVLEGKVTGVDARTTETMERSFYATLEKLVPDYEAINATQRWLQWLGEIDPVYGAPRQAALDAAFSRLDAERTAAVFKAYKATIPPAPSAGLENQVAPNGAASAPAPAANPAQGRIFSQKFVETFYNDIAKGKYRGREAEAERIVAEIDLAARDGRIR